MFNKIIAGSVAYVMLSFIVSAYAQGTCAPLCNCDCQCGATTDCSQCSGPSTCPPGWSLAPDNTCVIIGPKTATTYGAALAYCKNTYGAHLVTNKNSMKNTFLINLFTSTNLGSSVWLWTTRVDSSNNPSTSFIWSDGDDMTMYNNFAGSDPNGGSANELCVFINGGSGNQWYDYGCGQTGWSGFNFVALCHCLVISFVPGHTLVRCLRIDGVHYHGIWSRILEWSAWYWANTSRMSVCSHTPTL
ncbi:unnamed protein product [Oppiella nova]|uniref:C-type lectin domain-containing protein n=1 Tax=Oppiella nova TaxID=334625 RepID=A0A7R9LEZ7_9ACAR|nr:unnamed protein product [Oppiella nova]CAG2162473.1 unnamed protein product [Oppiella nova]